MDKLLALQQERGSIHVARLDVTDRAAVEGVLSQHPDINVLFNCAGWVWPATAWYQRGPGRLCALAQQVCGCPATPPATPSAGVFVMALSSRPRNGNGTCPSR